MERVLGELTFIDYRMLPLNVSSIIRKLLLGIIQEASTVCQGASLARIIEAYCNQDSKSKEERKGRRATRYKR
jgi:hypothetical protein